MQSWLAFQLAMGFPETYMLCRHNTSCVYYQYRYFHPIYGYINAKIAEIGKLAHHENVWNQ